MLEWRAPPPPPHCTLSICSTHCDEQVPCLPDAVLESGVTYKQNAVSGFPELGEKSWESCLCYVPWGGWPFPHSDLLLVVDIIHMIQTWTHTHTRARTHTHTHTRLLPGPGAFYIHLLDSS